MSVIDSSVPELKVHKLGWWEPRHYQGELNSGREDNMTTKMANTQERGDKTTKMTSTQEGGGKIATMADTQERGQEEKNKEAVSSSK